MSKRRPGVPMRRWQPSRRVCCSIRRFCVPPTAHWTMRPVPETTFFASAAICSASSRVGEITMARILSAFARLKPRGLSARDGSCSRIRWTTGTRKPSVLPVPVRACAMLGLIRRVHVIEGQDLHIHAAQSLVDGACLDFSHVCDPHLFGDGVYEIGVDQSSNGQVFESCSRTILRLLNRLLFFSSSVGGGILLLLLLPLRALVECGDGDSGELRCCISYQV
jgi:hypothetical protein